VILHDSSCLYHFKEHDIALPIAVIEELDQFKKGNETIHYHARNFLRMIDKLSEDHLFNGGVSIGPKHGKLSILLQQTVNKTLAAHFSQDKPDNKILNAAYCLSKKDTKRKVVLVSKDVNLRMKAKAVGLVAEDYTSDYVHDISEIYKGYRFEENVSVEVIDKMYARPFLISPKELKTKKKFLPNEYVIMRNDQKSALGHYDAETGNIHRIQKLSANGIKPRNAEQAFALHALLNENIKLVTISGKAGTGKTLLALAAALACRNNYGEVFIARPVMPLSGKDLGYLPGSITEKLNPYMQPLYDNLGVVRKERIESDRKSSKVIKLLEEENIVIAPLAYIRGRSLVDIYFIVDEAQNLTPHEVKTIITRAGENTKMVFTGDIFQIDHPYLDTYSNGLSYLINKMQGQKIYTHINLEKGERSQLAELASNIL
ncbi:MAG TPA: PhoH family protein, partial [Candidatus Omnitrophota bacterium]|nr:PhoH family protein [Candidatus Omnitrophota bacterium]